MNDKLAMLAMCVDRENESDASAATQQHTLAAANTSGRLLLTSPAAGSSSPVHTVDDNDEDVEDCRSVCSSTASRSTACSRQHPETDSAASPTNPGRQPRRRRLCSVKGCTRQAVKSGICISHGAEVSYKRCKAEGCGKFVVSGGVCVSHGAKVKPRRCKEEGCTKFALTGGLCMAHGGRVKKCSVEGCERYSQQAGLCIRHGAKVRNYKRSSDHSPSHDDRDSRIRESYNSPSQFETVNLLSTNTQSNRGKSLPRLPPLSLNIRVKGLQSDRSLISESPSAAYDRVGASGSATMGERGQSHYIYPRQFHFNSTSDDVSPRAGASPIPAESLRSPRPLMHTGVSSSQLSPKSHYRVSSSSAGHYASTTTATRPYTHYTSPASHVYAHPEHSSMKMPNEEGLNLRRRLGSKKHSSSLGAEGPSNSSLPAESRDNRLHHRVRSRSNHKSAPTSGGYYVPVVYYRYVSGPVAGLRQGAVAPPAVYCSPRAGSAPLGYDSQTYQNVTAQTSGPLPAHHAAAVGIPVVGSRFAYVHAEH